MSARAAVPRGSMARAKSWWQKRRIKHRDAVALCVLSASFLLAGELSNPVLVAVHTPHLAPPLAPPPPPPPRGTPTPFLEFLTTTLTGIGVLLGLATHTLMGQYALLLKKHARTAWRRGRRA